MKAIRIHQHGGPEAMVFDEVEIPTAGPGEVLIRHTAIGVNFIDVYFRTGLYPPPSGALPLIPGNEAAGVVLGLGEGVSGLKIGDRVAYPGPIGAYAEQRTIPADRVVKIPDGVSDEQAAAIMLKGITVAYLLLRTYKVKPGDTVLYHAAAGGVGLMFGRWAKHLGATVIGTAGSEAKVALAKANGYDHVINYSAGNFLDEVRALTGGAMCDVVYDSVGKDTFPASLDCLKPLGMFVSFGQSSGPVPPFNIGLLAQKGSLFATRPTIYSYIAKRADYEALAGALFEVVANGIVEINVNQRYKLADAAKAHSDLEGRKTTGASILLP